MDKFNFITPIKDQLILVDQCIENELYSDVILVNQISRYIIRSGGKRLRPVLVLLSALACNFNKNNSHILLATVIEFLHTATLLHDDVVDRSEFRRGKNTANTNWGNEASVLVGDFLYARAFQLLTNKLQNMHIMQVISEATAMIAEGEVLQLMNVGNFNLNENDYMNIIYCKTAKLFEACTHSAAVLSDVSDKKQIALKDYGKYVGIAFQLVDDVLDYSGNFENLGKKLGDDLSEGKNTLPLIYAQKYGSERVKQKIRAVIKTKDKNSFNDIQEILLETQALNYTKDKAKTFIKKAIDLLKVLDQNEYTKALKEIATYSADRIN